MNIHPLQFIELISAPVSSFPLSAPSLSHCELEAACPPHPPKRCNRWRACVLQCGRQIRVVLIIEVMSGTGINCAFYMADLTIEKNVKFLVLL